jgi:hypothetical protein
MTAFLFGEVMSPHHNADARVNTKGAVLLEGLEAMQ